MKRPPRIYPRNGIFQCAIWVESIRDYIKRSTGIPVDIVPPTKRTPPVALADDPDWWRESAHAKAIEDFIEDMRYARATAIRGVIEEPRPTLVSLESLLAEYNKVTDQLSGEKSPKTYERRELAVRAFQHYYHHSFISAVSEDQALGFRKKMTLDKYSPHTIKGYIKALRTLFAYALRKGYVAENPFEGIRVKIKHKPPKRITREEEYRLYTFMWQYKRPLFFQILFERATGFRARDVCDFEKAFIDAKHEIILYDNQKGVRYEEYPYAKLHQLLISMMQEDDSDGDHQFKYRDRRTSYGYLVKAAKWSGIKHITAHDLKRFYSQEIAPFCPDERTFAYLMHHAPGGVTKTAVEYYLGRDLIAGRKVLDGAQSHWIDFIRSIQDLPEIESDHGWGNAKRKKG